MITKATIRVVLVSFLLCSFLIAGSYAIFGAQSPQRIKKGEEITTSHEGFILTSTFTRNLETGMNTIIYGAAIIRRVTATVDWLSAAFRFELNPDNPEKVSTYQYGSWIEPKTYDAAILPGVDYSVIVNIKDIPNGEIKFCAPAHLPLSRIIWDWAEAILKRMERLGQAGFISLISKTPMIEFHSTVKKTDHNPDQFEYHYLVRNLSDKKIYFKWTSSLNQDLPSGWDGTLEPKKGATLEESIAMGYKDYLGITFSGGPPIEIIDVAVFNTESRELLPSLENLGLQGDLKDRIIGGFDDVAETVGLKDLPLDDINIITMAPAFISPE